MKKFCTKCGHEFEAVGREVICPACKQAAAAETKRAAVERAKRASWTGESVPVRISGRASTVIRRYGTEHNLPFASALDELLKSTDYFKSVGTKWEEVEPYKSHRRDRSTTETAQEAQDVPQDVPQEVKQEVKRTAVPFGDFGVVISSETAASKASASKTAGKAASKASASKTAGKAASKASASKK